MGLVGLVGARFDFTVRESSTAAAAVASSSATGIVSVRAHASVCAHAHLLEGQTTPSDT